MTTPAETSAPQHNGSPGPKRAQRITTSAGIDIAANIWDGDKTTIVLAHGGGQTQHSWGGTAATLSARGHRVVTYDLRGHGDSSWASDAAYTHAAYGSDAQDIARWCGEPVIWIGASLGGISGLIALDAEPDVFAALVLVDITHRPASTGVDRVLGFMSADIEHGFASIDDAADAVAAYQPHRKRPSSNAGLAKNLRLGDDGRWRWHWDPAFLTRRSSNDFGPDHWKDLDRACQRITTPTLLIRGRLSDLVTDAEVEAFRALVPHAQYVDVADAAHMIAGDKNDIFTDAVADFVASLDSAAAS